VQQPFPIEEPLVPEAVIVSTARSPIGRAFKGSLKDMRPDDLAAAIVKAALDKVPALDPRDVDDLMLGCGLPGGEQGMNMGRVVATLLGFDHLPGTTITRYCSSSLQTTRMALHAIKAGEGDVFISAGVETVSRFVKGNSDMIPGQELTNPLYADAQARTAERQAAGAEDWSDPREDGQLPDVYIAMGETAENVARLKGVSRQEMDEFAARSQNLAEKAIANGFFEREITPVTTPDGTVVSTDDGPRAGTTVEALSGLKPVFRPNGLITAGNACPLNDGASAVVIMSDTKAKELGLTPLARIVSTSVTGLSPEIMGLGPVEAIKKALALAGKTVDDIDLFEINEAFAAQVIPSYKEVGIPLDKLNVNGGAIALGHPFGSTGARITGTLLNGLQTADKTWGVESMCVGGGMGMAMVLERLS
jgi:acetyl-CoA C-acetyltransferase